MGLEEDEGLAPVIPSSEAYGKKEDSPLPSAKDAVYSMLGRLEKPAFLQQFSKHNALYTKNYIVASGSIALF